MLAYYCNLIFEFVSKTSVTIFLYMRCSTINTFRFALYNHTKLATRRNMQLMRFTIYVSYLIVVCDKFQTNASPRSKCAFLYECRVCSLRSKCAYWCVGCVCLQRSKCAFLYVCCVCSQRSKCAFLYVGCVCSIIILLSVLV